MIDTSTEFGRRAERRLRDETVGWLTTVSPAGQPKTIPIWFLWQDDASLLMYSQAETFKLRNIEHNPRVSFNLNSDPSGNDIIRLEGKAEICTAPLAIDVPAFNEKYADRMASMQMTPESFSRDYSVPLLVKSPKLRGF